MYEYASVVPSSELDQIDKRGPSASLEEGQNKAVIKVQGMRIVILC